MPHVVEKAGHGEGEGGEVHVAERTNSGQIDGIDGKGRQRCDQKDRPFVYDTRVNRSLSGG